MGNDVCLKSAEKMPGERVFPGRSAIQDELFFYNGTREGG